MVFFRGNGYKRIWHAGSFIMMATFGISDLQGLLLLAWASLVAQWLKRLPRMQETWVQFLSREDPLEKEMVTYSSILAWRIPWTEEPGRLQSTGSQRVRCD